MTNPQHGLALSDQAGDLIKWLDSNGHPKAFLNPAVDPPIDSSRFNVWNAASYDVRGMPHISLQFTWNGDGENYMGFSIFTSLDDKEYILLDPSLFVIVPSGAPFLVPGGGMSFLTLLLRTNFLRIQATTGGPPPFEDSRFVVNIVAGEA